MKKLFICQDDYLCRVYEYKLYQINHNFLDQVSSICVLTQHNFSLFLIVFASPIFPLRPYFSVFSFLLAFPCSPLSSLVCSLLSLLFPFSFLPSHRQAYKCKHGHRQNHKHINTFECMQVCTYILL